MVLMDQLNTDMKEAMKAKDKPTLGTVRMLKAALQNKQIAKGEALTPDDEKAVLSTELKQRKESLADFKAADRQDLVDQLEGEIAVVERYLPKQLSDAEVEAIVDATIAAVGATGKSDFGKVMKALMPKVKGQADGAVVNGFVKAKLG
ncbi:GatB/YqeY domain-containing protein [Lacticaseibacillus daqingensis]|uniref:GatB/YqeY domain-containing protein n=1 Tax=Lacticaseibacillus daqingensis TaxID=2486014 RepID=UPI000F76F766|nr:GatB/YqeY domain-containing protein [Lacticaseibacillus daqingensis]